MSGSPLVQAIQGRLRSVGYSDLSAPFTMAGVQFTFTSVMRGRDGRALDLILLVDTTTGDADDRDGGRVRQRIEALSRALDVTGSRFVITAILAGAALADGIEALSETCRVLQVEGIALDAAGKPVDETAERQLDDRIRILLPLTLPVPPTPTQDGNGPAMEQLIRALPTTTDKTLMDVVISTSGTGEDAVTDAVAQLIAGVFQFEPGGDES